MAKPSLEQQLEILRSLVTEMEEAVASTQSLGEKSAKAEVQLLRQRVSSLRMIEARQLESLNRVQRAELKAEHEIESLRYRHEEALTSIRTKQALLDKKNFEAYAKAWSDDKIAQRQASNAQLVIDARLEGVDRVKRAALMAEEEIGEVRLKREQTLTNVAKQRALITGYN